MAIKKIKKEMISILAMNHSKYLIAPLRDYTWIDEYFQTQALRAQIFDAREMLSTTRALPAAKTDILAAAKINYDEFLSNRAGIIQKAFLNPQPAENPLARITDLGMINGAGMLTTPFMGFVSWQEIEQAILAMEEDPAAISKKDRHSTISHLEKKIAELEAQLEKLLPKTSRFYGNAGDIRDEFVQYWIHLQKKCDAPVSPLGKHLKYSPEEEKAAHKRLKIDIYVNPAAPFQPYDPSTKGGE